VNRDVAEQISKERDEDAGSRRNYPMNAAGAANVVPPDPSRFNTRDEAQKTTEPSIPHRIRKHGFATFRVGDNRMFPWIRRGDLVFIRRVDFGAVRAGDCVLIERGSRVVFRRVLRLARVGAEGNAERALVVKSYAHARREDFVTPRQFLGRAVRIHRRTSHIDAESFERVVLAKVLASVSIVKYNVQRPIRSLKKMLST
jgi:hypothetical protein